MEILGPIAVGILGLLSLLAGLRSKRKVLEQLNNSPPVPVVLKRRERREEMGDGGAYYSYWWSVMRVDGNRHELVQVTKRIFDQHIVGHSFKLYEYPGTTRLVTRDNLGG